MKFCHNSLGNTNVNFHLHRTEHPELFPEPDHAPRDRHKAGTTYTGPPKPVTAQQIFIQAKIEEALAKDKDVSKGQDTNVSKACYWNLVLICHL